MDCMVESSTIIESEEGFQMHGDDSDNEDVCIIRRKSKPQKCFDSDDENDQASEELPSSNQQQRVHKKRCKMKQKFLKLASLHKKDENDKEGNETLDEFNMEKHTVDPSIYDRSSTSSDSSDQEDDISEIKKRYEKPKLKQKSTKLLDQVPMSVKQAMENMQKIKSESNRMLREKEVSLPYHKPKPLSLKDIMSRRKPAMTSDGKRFPLKMNGDQLKQYAQMLEQRQKEIIELCRSDSESESEVQNEDDKPILEIPEDDVLDENGELPIVMLTGANTQGTEIDGDINNTKIELEVEANKHIDKNDSTAEINLDCAKDNKEDDSQLISLHYTENTENNTDKEQTNIVNNNSTNSSKEVMNADFSDDDSDIGDIDTIIENAVTGQNNSNIIKQDIPKLTGAPGVVIDLDDVGLPVPKKLIGTPGMVIDLDDVGLPVPKKSIGAPGMVIDLDDDGSPVPKKLIGTPGMVIDLDDDGSPVPKKLTGVELLKERFIYFSKLKTPEELERENDKRIKPTNHHQRLRQELEEKIAEQRSLEWAKRLEEEKQRQSELKDLRGETSDAEDEDDLEKMEAKLTEIDDFDIKAALENGSVRDEDLIEDDIDMSDKKRESNPLIEDEAEVSEDEEAAEGVAIDDKESEESSSDDTSDESEDEQQVNVKRGRILKAFEDSDDEAENETVSETDRVAVENVNTSSRSLSQEDELPSAQLHQSIAEDMVTNQENNETISSGNNDIDTLLKSDILNVDKILHENENSICNGIADITDTQTCNDAEFDDVVSMCSGTFSQNLVPNDADKSEEDFTQTSSTPLEEEVLELCTGNFYNNKFIDSQETNEKLEEPLQKPNEKSHDITKENILLKSILDELDDPDFDKPKQNKYFQAQSEVTQKKKLVIDSDEETIETDNSKRKKKLKKKREKRVLNISDDEDEEDPNNIDDGYIDEEMESEVDDNCDEEREVEYDSEENEVQLKPQKSKKKANDFFEHEAELTSEDEWIGSGDEDEAGLDRMEREAGDDDKFHQGHLLRELGQIHMREVLDQDKREVRMIQELLLEDGDLGDGHRRRTFRWRNIDEDEETDPIVDDNGESQVEEIESEEQWRRQRHERETFLRQQMKANEEAESPNVSINRTTIIKANLASKTMSNLLSELNASKIEKTEVVLEVEKKSTSKDVPSPIKKPFTMLQQKFRGSLLARGQGALARLAALAAPLADTNEHTTTTIAPSNRRNFVFTAISPHPGQKVTKRKAESNPGTPCLLKKIRTEEKSGPRRSLLDHMKI